jgi:ParB family chromosome partitioning protein
MQYKLMPRELLTPDDSQPRRSKDPERLQELVGSIRDQGILQPLIAYPDGNRNLIADGHRRYEGACLAGLKEIPVLMLTCKPDPDMLLLTQLTANGMREDLKLSDRALAYRRLKEMRGLTNAELASIMHVSKSLVTETLSYLELPPEALTLLDEGKIAGSTAYAISRAPDEATKQELLNKAIRGELRREDAARAVSRSPSVRTQKQRYTFCLASAEISVATDNEKDLECIIELFQELGRECRRAARQGLNVSTFQRVLKDKRESVG